MKKHIALLLCLIMMLSCLAGCGDSGDDQTTKAPETTGGQQTTEAPDDGTTEAPTEAEPALGELPLVKEETVITIGMPQSPLCTDYVDNEYTKWIEEQTGVKLEFVYFSNDATEQVTQLNLMLTNEKEELPDILWGFGGISDALRNELGEDGYFIDLLPYFEEYGYYSKQMMDLVNEGDREKIFQYGTNPADGALYVYPKYSEALVDTYNTHAVINTEWLKAIGEEMPTTVDELYTVLKKFKDEDPNGNGEADEIPMLGSDTRYRGDLMEWIINAYVYCCDQNVFNATDGKVWVPYTTDEYREALIFLNKLYKEGLVSPLFYSISTNPELKAMNTPADGTAVVGLTGGHTAVFYDLNNPLIFQYDAIPVLKAETELGGYAPTAGNSYEYKTFITCDAEDPVLCFKLLDFMSSLESTIRMRYGVPGVHWDYVTEDLTNAYGDKVVMKILDSSVYSAENNLMWKAIHGVFTTNGTMAVQTAAANTTTGSGHRSLINLKFYDIYKVTGKQPVETIEKLIYNAEENETAAELHSTLVNYFAEARALFVSGTLDPNNDADWQTYLNNLKSQGLEDLLEVAQSAYSRMQGE